MDATRQDITVAARVGYEWNPDFSTPQKKSRVGQNIPFWAHHRQNTDDPQDTCEILSQFLKEIFDGAGPVLYQAVPIREFCLPAKLSILATGEDARIQNQLALLDERNDYGLKEDTRGTCRRSIHDGALNASDLYKALRRKRYNAATHPNSSRDATATVASAPNDQENPSEADAERRLIYITNIDSWCMLALISTATSHQVSFLRDYIYRYLEFKTHIGVQVPTSGFQRFALEFHLPFYACKAGPELVKDQRLKINRKPLRRTGDLNFLKLAPFLTEASNPDDYICEAQISVLVTGVDHWSWTAFAFVDTYYKGADNQESVEHYIDQAQYGVKLDPLTEGRHEAEPPIWRPREYFLRVLESRVKQVKREWHNTVFRVLQKCDPEINDDLLSTPESRKIQVNKLDRNTQVFFDKTLQLTQRMSQMILLTLDAWAHFKETELTYFLNIEKTSSKHRTPTKLISMINKDMEDLHGLQRYLDDRRDGLRDVLQKLENGLQVENNALQQRNSLLITALTISTSFLGLVSTTAAIFSVQNNVNAGSVIGTVVALVVPVLLIFSYVLDWEWYVKVQEYLAGVKPDWNSSKRWFNMNFGRRKTPVIGNMPLPPGTQMTQLRNRDSTTV